MPVSPPSRRPLCQRCLRPLKACWCAGLNPVPTRTRIVFLQHPSEARVAIGTARIAHLGLANSELHEGIEFESHPRLAALRQLPNTALLFPGPGAIDPHHLPSPPDHLIVIDGTWPQARKIIALNPALQALPRIGFVPRRPGNYRIRKEPAAHCMATVEAVVEVLAALEGDEARFDHLLHAFNSMVEAQLAARAARTEPARRRLRPPLPWWLSAAMPDFLQLWPHFVILAAEANAHRRNSSIPGNPELIQLAAFRPSDNSGFQSFLTPRRPLAPSAHLHLEVTRDAILHGEPVPQALARWNSFLRPEDILLTWGPFALELLAGEAWSPSRPPIDLRIIAAHRLKRRPGTPEAAATAVHALPIPSPAPGRAGRTLAALAAFTTQLHDERRAGETAPIPATPEPPDTSHTPDTVTRAHAHAVQPPTAPATEPPAPCPAPRPTGQ